MITCSSEFLLQVKTETSEVVCRAITEYLMNSEEISEDAEDLFIFVVDEEHEEEKDDELDMIVGILEDLPKDKLEVSKCTDSNKPQYRLLYHFEQMYRALKLSLHYESLLRRCHRVLEELSAPGRHRKPLERDLIYCPELDIQYKVTILGNICTDSQIKK